jgi:hypothetical protein
MNLASKHLAKRLGTLRREANMLVRDVDVLLTNRDAAVPHELLNLKRCRTALGKARAVSMPARIEHKLLIQAIGAADHGKIYLHAFKQPNPLMQSVQGRRSVMPLAALEQPGRLRPQSKQFLHNRLSACRQGDRTSRIDRLPLSHRYYSTGNVIPPEPHTLYGPESAVNHQDRRMFQRVGAQRQVQVLHLTRQHKLTDALSRQSAYTRHAGYQLQFIRTLERLADGRQVAVNGGNSDSLGAISGVERERIFVNIAEFGILPGRVLEDLPRALSVKINSALFDGMQAHKVQELAGHEGVEWRALGRVNPAILKGGVTAHLCLNQLRNVLVGLLRGALKPLSMVNEVVMPYLATLGQTHGAECIK